MNLTKEEISRKGLSTIVITLILILLSLVAVGIIWFVISRILREASGETEFSQFTISLDITNAYESNGNIVAIVKRNVGSGDVVGLKFLIYGGEESESYNVDYSIKELESKKFTIPVSQFNSKEVDEIAVAPFYLSSGEKKLGNILDTYKITKSYNEASSPEETEEPEGGTTECTPDCTNLECGLDPICGHSCGVCSGETVCRNGVCVSESCVSESNEITCGGVECGTKVNNCGEIINCGNCPFGETCKNGICEIVGPLNTGTVEDLWPGDSGMYFGSTNLPTDISYQGYYIYFPGSAETHCLLISVYRFPVEGYTKSHVGFNFATSLRVGDQYEIYENIDGCPATG